jgi:hypothetical protein
MGDNHPMMLPIPEAFNLTKFGRRMLLIYHHLENLNSLNVAIAIHSELIFVSLAIKENSS